MALNKQSAKKKQITLDKSCYVLPYTKNKNNSWNIFLLGVWKGGGGNSIVGKPMWQPLQLIHKLYDFE